MSEDWQGTGQTVAFQQEPGMLRATTTCIDIDTATADLLALHQLVAHHNDRIELTTRDGQTTVLISKDELAALEAALEILGNTKDVCAMREELARVAAIAMGRVA